MFRVFASNGASKKLSDEHRRTALPVWLSHDEAHVHHVRIAILGTGFSGLGMAIRLKQHGQEDFVVLERAADIGGTWRDNTYPGCACDIPSHLYSFSFALNPHWSRMYSSQREIWHYLRRCARRFGILPHIRWNSELLDASWNEDEQRWYIAGKTKPEVEQLFSKTKGIKRVNNVSLFLTDRIPSNITVVVRGVEILQSELCLEKEQGVQSWQTRTSLRQPGR